MIWELPAGRELDGLVAEKVMGWMNVTSNLALGVAIRIGDAPSGHQRIVPCYSTDIAEAWRVLEMVRTWPPPGVRHVLVEFCSLGWNASCVPAGKARVSQLGETAALAICRMALALVVVTKKGSRAK